MNTNSIAFTALCREYCAEINAATQRPVIEFVGAMLKILPRLYICATDLSVENDGLHPDEDAWMEQSLTEEDYEMTRQLLSGFLGEEDVYLEVFIDDMKYSDTPVSSSISENLADLYLVAFDFMNVVRSSTDQVVDMAIMSVKESFREYWSMTLCNVLRALNHIWSRGLSGQYD